METALNGGRYNSPVDHGHAQLIALPVPKVGGAC